MIGTPISKSPSLASIRETFNRAESFSSLSAYLPAAPGTDGERKRRAGKYVGLRNLKALPLWTRIIEGTG